MWVRICTQVQQHSYMYATSRYDDEMTPPERPARGPEAARATRAPRSRVPWGTISREQVLEAATRVVKAGGYEEMTIRSLAAELGIAPMSLYRHVRDKDDILDEVVDRLLARAWRPRAKKSDWQAWVAEAADRLRRFLVTQPAALHVYLRHPVVSAAAMARMNAMMEVLRQMGTGEEGARGAYAAVHTYTIGFAALEASRASWLPVDGDRGAETAKQLAAFTTPRQFAVGLRYLLEGIERDAEARRDRGAKDL